MSHSPEPWEISSDRRAIIAGENSHLVGFIKMDGAELLSPEDVARIVACVNFCRELDTAFLNAHILKNPVPADEWVGCREEQFACWAAVVRA